MQATASVLRWTGLLTKSAIALIDLDESNCKVTVAYRNGAAGTAAEAASYG
jgi:hypothetical protein